MEYWRRPAHEPAGDDESAEGTKADLRTRTYESGSVIVNRLPWPTVLSTVTVPP